MPAQYGEDAILSDYFGNRAPGFFVDVGAADGFDNSNTFHLARRGWKGILIEPNPSDFKKLSNLYKDKPDYTLLNMAVFDAPGEKTFYCEPGQASTLSEEFRDRVISLYKTKYQEVTVKCDTLTNTLDSVSCPKVIDFLSIDAEGVDMVVLTSMDWEKYFVELACIEHSMPKDVLRAYMDSVGFIYYTETAGNTFFINPNKRI